MNRSGTAQRIGFLGARCASARSWVSGIRATLAALVSSALLLGCGGDGGGAAALQSLVLAPVDPSIAAGLRTQLSATGLYSDGTSHDVTQQVMWSSANPAAATVGATTGNALAVAVGTAALTATLDGITGTDSVTVTGAMLVSLAVSPSTASIAAGAQQSFEAIGTYTDATTKNVSANVSWSSSAPGVATITAAGVATGVTPGPTMLTATCSVKTECGTSTAAATLTVTPAALLSISVTGGVPSLAAGQTEALTVIGLYTDQSTQTLTSQAGWSSSNKAVATISSQGIVTAMSPGNVTLTATVAGVVGSTPLTVSFATLGLTWPVITYEAEAATLTGGAVIVGAADGSDRSVGDLGGEASQRQAVLLTNAGDAVTVTVSAAAAGANAVVIRYSIPDAPAGGGALGSLAVNLADATGKPLAQRSLQLTSRYAWLYGGVEDGTKLFDVPANATRYATANTPTHLYDEIQLKLGIALQAGNTVTLAKTATSGAATIAVDLIDLETVPAPIPLPAGFVSLTDARCGGIALDLRQSGSVFDGADDSSYGSVFNSVLGNNPFNPATFAVIEKIYYSTDPSTDLLQDTTPMGASANLSMWGLADHNFQSVNSCMSLVTASGGKLTGVYIPPGRFYIRGYLQLPSNITLQGAGMWYSKFAAVDTAPPTAVTTPAGLTGIASVSGNLVISSQPGGADNVILSNFSIFGNATQRDGVDSVIPDGIRAQLTNSIIDNVWVEHTFSGIKTNLNSSAVLFENCRARNVFADGIDFYGSTSNSSIKNCSSRSTGDDGFAMWSQGTTLASSSQSNSISNSSAALQWYGNGFAIYGGTDISITSSRAADVLNYPCFQASTYFDSASLPAGVAMSASASQLDFYRCGGNGYNQQYGAVALVTDTESIASITLDQINIANPAYKAFDFRSIPIPASHSVVATITATVQNASVVGGPACAVAGAYTGGTVQFNDVCICATASSPALACAATIPGTSTLKVSPNTCSATVCPVF